MNVARAIGPGYDALRVSGLLGIDYVSGTGGPRPVGLPAYLTYWDPGWTILRLRDVVRGEGMIFHLESPCDKEPFAKLKEEPRYRQLRMEAIPESFGKPFAEQQALVPAGEEIPTARVVLMGMVIHFLATGIRLFPNHFVRCAEVAAAEYVTVGSTEGDTCARVEYWKDGCDFGIGLASARKF